MGVGFMYVQGLTLPTGWMSSRVEGRERQRGLSKGRFTCISYQQRLVRWLPSSDGQTLADSGMRYLCW